VGRAASLIPLLAALGVPAAGAATPPQIAFKQSPGDHYGIVLLDQAGAGAVELTRGRPMPAFAGTFSWSPDGSRLVYASAGLVGGDLYSVAADGADLRRLTVGGGNEYPAWSPDGGRIAYVHTVRVRRPGGTYRLDDEIWLVGAVGGNAQRLSHDAGAKYSPRWSPDGSRLLYSESVPYSHSGLFVVDPDTGRVLLHTADRDGTWSPDGSRLAVDSSRGIDVINADGTGRHTVATSAGGLQWSPDGTLIAFSRSHCTPGVKGLCGVNLQSVYTVGADGSGERRLTGPLGSGPGTELDGFPLDTSSRPAWWPDGSRLFFERDDQAYVMNADGTCEQPFGPTNLLLGEPAWRPGSEPSLPPLRCADVRVRATPDRTPIGLRDEGRLRVTLENDGNETSPAPKLTLRFVAGRGRLSLALPSCRGTAVVECDLAPLAAGATEELAVTLARSKRPAGYQVQTSIAAGGTRLGRGTAYLQVLDCDIVGTAGADRLVGTPRRDRICGLPGPDRIDAGAGNDDIEGGAGADTIVLGPGRDVVSGGEGRDRIFARDGERDVIDCGLFRDTVYADRIDQVAHDCERVVR
jgi:Tol biopolymer transport system component